jgi:hypothetical protein
MYGANPGIVPASPDVAINVQAFCLKEAVQDFRISGNDRSYDRIIRVNSHTCFGQTGRDLGAQLITDGRQIDGADVDRDSSREVLVQSTDRRHECIINDAV